VAFYELGMSQSVDDLAAAVQSLDRAIALKPDFVAARAGRGMLLYSQNRPEAALPDLQFAIDKLPADAPGRATLLDRLGQTFVALDRLKEAIQPLRKAAELSPDDSTTQLHLANALAEAGQTEESDALMAHFRQMRPGARAPKVTGVVDYLSMTPETRRALYQARLEKAVHDHPEEVNSQLLYLKFLLMNGKMTEAGETARKLAALRPGAVALAEAGHALLLAGAYSDAKELLAQAASADMSVGVTLDLAMASFHAAGAATAAADEGLRQLDRIPEAARTAGYYLARAQMLDATGRPVEGIAEMDRALAAAPRDPDLYWQAAVMMLRGDRANDALRLLDGAEKALPQEAEIPVIRAAMLELAGKTDDARHVLNEAQRRWPEVAAVWTAQGIILAAHGQADEARTALETAVTLGAHSPETFYALAESSLRSGPRNIAAAEAAILEASRLAPDDVRTKALSARIAERRKGIAPTEGMAWREEALDPARLFEARPPREW
jgi:tetratricopeptide (TPR) repeat protein